MKYMMYVLLSLTLMSCASNRGPASAEREDVKEGINTDYYFTR